MLDSIHPSKITYYDIEVNRSEQVDIVSNLAKKVTIWIRECDKKHFEQNHYSVTDSLIIKNIRSLEFVNHFPNIK